MLLANGTSVQKLQTNNSSWVQVEVRSGVHTGRRGWIMAHFFSGG